MKRHFLIAFLFGTCFISYASGYAGSNIISLDTIPDGMHPVESADTLKTNELEEFVVKGNTGYVKLKGTNFTVDISHSPLGDMPNTEDMLSQLPFVKGDGGSFSIMGKGKAVIYIGNRKIQDSAELTRILPSDIRSVEIIRNPGVEYDAEDVAVIKIILKRKISDGLGVRAYTSESLGRKFSDYQQLSLSYASGVADLFLTGDNNSYRIRADQTNLHTFYTPAAVWRMRSEMPSWNAEYYRWTISGGGNVSLPSGHNMGAKITYTNDTGHNTGHTLSVMERDGEEYEILNSNTYSPGHYHQWQVNAYYDGNLSDKINLNFNGDYVGRISESTNIIEEEGTLTPVHTVINGTASRYRLWSGIAKLDWRMSEQSDLSLGADGSIIRNHHSSVQNDPAESSLLDSREDKYAFFCQYSLAFQRYRLDAGLRYETMHLDYRDGEDNSSILNRTYGRLFPTATISAVFGNVNMAAGFNSHIRRPTFYQLRTGSDYFNRYLTVTGNPLLLPTYTYELSYSLQYSGLVLNLGCRWVHNPIENESITYSDNPLERLRYPVNARKYEAFTASANYSREIAFWRGNLSASLSKTFYGQRRDYPGMPVMGNTPYMEFSMSNYFSFSGNTAYININYNPPGTDCDTRMGSFTDISLGIYRRFLKRALYVSLRVTNILACKTKYRSYERDDVFEKTQYRDARRVVLTVSYTFRHKNKYKGKDLTGGEISRI